MIQCRLAKSPANAGSAEQNNRPALMSRSSLRRRGPHDACPFRDQVSPSVEGEGGAVLDGADDGGGVLDRI